MTCYLRAFDKEGYEITDWANEFKTLQDARNEIKNHYQHAYKVKVFNYETGELHEEWVEV